MSNLEFAVGKRVVCVKDFERRRLFGPFIPQQWPVKGCIYTIREIETRFPNGYLGLRLEEIVNPKEPLFEGAYDASKFRPVRETSIDCFTALLEKPPVRQTEAV